MLSGITAVQGVHMITRTLVLLSAFAMLGAAAERTIYRCSVGGVTTFSDRPCGDSTQVHSLDVAAASPAVVPERQKVATNSVRKPAATRIAGAGARDGRRDECVRLDSQLRRLSARMRAGYTAAVGERLREQQRELRARHRELRCR
jgi:hypothetical protein